ncbi:MAG: 16S rRNA (adenine(1518)-N(6)/adenine(1519)-N(6))-dimethyltransferase RsmA [Candidatus Pacebacteria bacterium]|jgi:16S rRNA (adenine1518-N6/adenine1519-N6)-dimethyltransferase|nr:16S rRNA (adenine(1518)-N(6)/adenine(1519)-N(6))-dimethyltransferase RsmA [Candidatus Paceibacterota bacterium]
MIQAKKSLGQNFLNSKTVARDIVRAAYLSSSDTVLEIGPGKGFLTSELLASGAHVIAVEKDDRMIPLLSEKFAEEIVQKKFTLIHGDVLEELEKKTISLPAQYKLVANIPYYLTGQIIRTFLEAKNKPIQMVLMVQKEVATRIVARDKKESILSIAVKAFGDPKLIKKVPARYFTPAPKVDSAVLSIENISGKNFPTKKSEERFFEIVRTGFAHKRKVLSGNLKELFSDETIEILASANIKDKTRAENLVLKDWLTLSKS